jgi:uncharacterized membrane protein
MKMKKLMLLAALLAMLALAAVPAIAQIGQEGEQESESGEVDQSFTVTSEGDNSNQCAGIQGGSEADDFEFDEVGSSVDVSPSSTTECNQQVNQAASATG